MPDPTDPVEAILTRLARIEMQLGDLALRVTALEDAQAPTPAAPERAHPVAGGWHAPAAEPGIAVDQTAAAEADAAPVAAVAAGGTPSEDEDFDEADVPAPPPAAPAIDWERLIGGRWALWVGAAAVFFAVAFFLAQAWQALAPEARVASGVALGLLLLGIAHFAHKRSQSWFGEGLAGAGLALFYLDVWAASHQYHLINNPTAAALLVGITAVGATLAVRLDAPSLIALSTAGGFVTPLLLGSGQPRHMGPAAYAAVLDMGLLGVSLFRRWPALGWACLVGTAVLWTASEPVGIEGQAFALASLIFGLFTAAAVGYGLRKGESTAPHDVLLLLVAAFGYAAVGFTLVETLFPATKVAFPLVLAALFLALAVGGRQRLPTNRPFHLACDALAIFFLTDAVPIAFSQNATATAWIVEAALLTGVGMKFDTLLYRVLGGGVGLLGATTGAYLALNDSSARSDAWSAAPAAWQAANWPTINARTLPIAIGALAAVALVAWAQRLGRQTGWGTLLALVAAVTGWILLDIQFLHLLGDAEERFTQALVALAAGVAFACGVRWPDARLRLTALTWWACTALVVVCQDPFATAAARIDGRPVATGAMVLAACGMVLAARRLPALTSLDALVPPLPIATVLLTVWALSIEAHAAVAPTWPHAGQLAVSFVWIASGVACMLGGMRAAVKAFRLLGLALLGASAVKVFLFDLAFLDTGARIAAFAGLGVALIGISWLYGREQQADSAQPPSKEPS